LQDEKESSEDKNGASADGTVTRVSTRQWAEESGYDAEKIFTKLFDNDISYLLTMDKLWSKRTPPKPLKWAELQSRPEEKGEEKEASESNGGIKDQIVWSIQQCVDVFQKSVQKLKKLSQVGGHIFSKGSATIVLSRCRILGPVRQEPGVGQGRRACHGLCCRVRQHTLSDLYHSD
jgi:hypothetical protein